MHAFQWFDGVDVWQVAGWTMLHFLWAGALAGLIAGACRLVLRRASANVRYVAALACLAVLAALPVGIGTWLVAQPQVMHSPFMTVEPIAVAETPQPETKEGVDLAVTHLGAPSAKDTTPIAGDRLESSAPIAGAPSLPRIAATISQSVAGYLPWVWIIGTPLTFVVLATGMVGAERFRRSSHVLHDGPIAEACARLVKSLRIGRRATVAVCERIAAPVLVGIVRPIILLPPAAITGWSPDEIEMVLLHELAHVRRWDNLVNLVQRIVESVLFFHPAVWLVSNWVRHEREACCDALVVGLTNQPQAYAELLVALAAQLPRSMLFHPAAASAMASGPLRGRVRRILKLEDDPMLVSGKSLGVMMTGLLLLVTLVVLNLPVRGQAIESTLSETNPALDQAGGLTSVADALGQYRRAVVGYDLDFDSVLPDRGWVTYDAKRLERYPTPDAWPDVLGHVDTDADKFRVVTERPAEKFETVTAGNAYLVPLDWSVGTKDYATLLFLRGIAADAHVVAHSYTSFACFGAMAGDVLFKSYATALVQGDMSGQITGDSYFNLVVTGKFTGRLYAGTYAMIYLVGGFDGELELERSKVYIAGRTPKAALQRIKGAGKVYLEESDLTPGEHQIGDLVVTVKEKEFAAVESPQEVDNSPSKAASPDSALLRDDRDSVPVHFVLGATRFNDGDKITIQEVRGTAESFAPGNLYWIKGTYTLGSRDRAALSAYTTAKDSANGTSPTWKIQTTVVDRGSGTFTLCLPMSHGGWPHVSFYPADGGESFGGTYFGTGDSVLKEWWGPNEVVDSTSAGAQGESGQSPESYGRSTTLATEQKFPSLEDQKLADLAWKRLGVELEKIGGEDVKRARALGYEGGVKVGAVTDRTIGQPMQEGDVLVGLHIWPTRSLEDVAAVLNRDDLAELNPLKYYVVRRTEDGGGYGGGRGAAPDTVVAGRISVSLPDHRHDKISDQDLFAVPILPRVEAAEPVPIPLGSSDPRALETAPSSEKAVDEALASDPKLAMLNQRLMELQSQWQADDLGAAGKNPRAADRIKLEIGATQKAIHDYREQVREQLEDVPQNESTLRYDGKTFDEWRDVWTTTSPIGTERRLEVLMAMEAFGAAGYRQEAAKAILYGTFSDSEVAPHSRKYLSTLSSHDAQPIVENLVDVLNTDLSAKRRTSALRALAAIGPNAATALEVLKLRLTSSDRAERIAAAAAIKMIIGKDRYQKPVADVLGKELGITVVESNGVWGALPREDSKDEGKAFADFTDAVIKEQQQLFPDGKF